MRTKLDEIVEEEFESWRRCDTFSRHAAVKRIAERAFRHGVEQAQLAAASVYLGHVQPAPAEEKAKGHYHGTINSPNTFTTTLEECFCSNYSVDRRKGERRKPGGYCWHNRENWLCKLSVLDRERLAHGDSRSGKDRRQRKSG